MKKKLKQAFKKSYMRLGLSNIVIIIVFDISIYNPGPIGDLQKKLHEIRSFKYGIDKFM